MAVVKKCPYCGGRLVGDKASRTILKPLCGTDDYIWQCEGSCQMLIFNQTLKGIDSTLKNMKDSR